MIRMLNYIKEAFLLLGYLPQCRHCELRAELELGSQAPGPRAACTVLAAGSEVEKVLSVPTSVQRIRHDIGVGWRAGRRAGRNEGC